MIPCLHSWEFDPDQPRVGRAGRMRTARHYVSLSRTPPRIRRLIGWLEGAGASFMTARDFVERVAAQARSPRAVGP